MTMEPQSVFTKSLFEICQAMVSSLELGEVLHTILDLSLKSLTADAGSILLYEEGSDELKMLASRGLPPNVVKRGHISRKGSVAEWVINNNKPIIVNKRSDIFPDSPDELPSANAIKSAMSAPLRAKGQIIGTINLNRYSAEAALFVEDELHTLEILASQAAVCIENARLHEQNMLQARMAAIGQTVAGISHCVKNMLTGLRGGLGILEIAEKESDWDTVHKATGFIRSNVERISLLVLDMLDYSREKTPLRHLAIPEKMIQEVFDIVASKAERKTITLSKKIEKDCTEIMVDPDQIFRCLLNLVENALDAVERGGKIQVRCEPASPEQIQEVFAEVEDISSLGKIVRFSVEDNGCGIAPENRRHLFQPFSSTKGSKGTGLGLAVTQKITQEHGGKALVETEVGKGTTFHLILPEKTPIRPAQAEQEGNTPSGESPAR
jgi:signal transduction histidine kinase